jgi:adenylate cyclase
MPRFVIHHGTEGPRVFELIGDRPVSIGRTKSSNLVLDDPSVSRLHAIVGVTPEGGWQIVDRNSANGIRVNGSIVREALLHSNDEIAIGEYKLRFEDSVARKVTSYGTAKLPARFAEVLKESSYAGASMPVEIVAEVAQPESQKRVSPAERVRALENENRLLTLLYRVNHSLAELKCVEEVTHRVLDLVLEIDGAERGYAMLLDDESMFRGNFSQPGYTFLPAVIRYRSPAAGGQNQSMPQLTISHSIIHQVMKAGLPILVSEGQADPRFSASKSVIRSGIQSAMCAPLGIGNRLRGLLYVDNLSRRGMFTLDDLNVFAVIAVQGGLGIDRVRNRQELAEPVRS